MREAYRKKGWAFKSHENIEQCKREGYGEKMKSQQNEGCMVYGFIEVNKVSFLKLIIPMDPRSSSVNVAQILLIEKKAQQN